MKTILGPYNNKITPETDRFIKQEIVILKSEDDIIHSIQEVNVYLSKESGIHYCLFHALYGRNALNFIPDDYRQIQEQVSLPENALIIDDFKPSPRVTKDFDLFLVSKPTY